jgi:hypothetical protein
MLDKNKSELCYCKKSFHSGEKIFEKGKYYEFNFDDSMRKNTVWVIYDKNGEFGRQGYRFYVNEPTWELPPFDIFFDHVDRKYKLNNLIKNVC